MQESFSKNENTSKKNSPYWTPQKRSDLLVLIRNLINQKYIIPEIAKKLDEYLSSAENLRQFIEIPDPILFAQTLTEKLQRESKDFHFWIEYSSTPKISSGEHKDEKIETEIEKDLYFNLQKYRNGNLIEVKRLPGNIGYFRLDEFPEVELFGETFLAGMRFLENTDAIIFDVRYNGGGNADFVQIMVSYFFEGDPKLLYHFEDTESTEIVQMWTLPLVGVKKQPKKIISILTSGRSASGAEDFAYTMQSQNRAKIVGEPTRGAANNPKLFFLDDHFSIELPIGRPVNAVTNTNWEQKGVIPDLKVSQEKALESAHLDLINQMKEKIENPAVKKLLEFEMGYVHAYYSAQEISKELASTLTGDYGPSSVRYQEGQLYFTRKNLIFPLKTVDFLNYYCNEQQRIQFKTDTEGNYLLLEIRDYENPLKLKKKIP
ncbi:S41 family peptidase [Promethearchaeum syntrophicum]|uniref:S41 family peptidase n=1 Tax=Promethearchaeum syntrophicum TaxID=2594042 RepID=A0A5B9DG93_9ARCH|nr:S41 family peptidase [Candidatus Prometheoarchaeum syntrophicum]QEE18075.1 Peptidase family S41 [Candidatus Prometheoarchaeum syntrophicum]